MHLAETHSGKCSSQEHYQCSDQLENDTCCILLIAHIKIMNEKSHVAVMGL